MKKLLLTIIAFFAVSVSVYADGHVDSVRYLTTRWRRNWFVSAGASCNWWQGSMNVPEGFVNSYTKVDFAHPRFGFTVNFGKWINHKTGVRISYNNTRIDSYIAGRHGGLNHIQFLYGDNPQVAESYGGITIYKTSMRYHNLVAQYMIRPIDFFQGYYNPKRIWTPVLYLNAGAGLNSNDLFIIQSLTKYYNYQKHKDVGKYEGTNFELALGAGLLNDFRISDHFDIFLGIDWTFHRWTIDSWEHEIGGKDFVDGDGNSFRPKRFDNLYSVSLGLTYYFSRIYDLYDPMPCQEVLPYDTVYVMDTIVKFVTINSDEMVSYPFSIFFHRDSYQLMSNRDLVNLAEIARVAKEYNYKIRLRGSCDSATATLAYNQTLSENRCRRIMLELLEMGIPESQIILVPIGGIKELNPTEYDRRVLVELVKELE